MFVALTTEQGVVVALGAVLIGSVSALVFAIWCWSAPLRDPWEGDQ